MSEEEIKNLAASLGLDEKQLKLYEPYSDSSHSQRYTMEYNIRGVLYGYCFRVDSDDRKDIAIPFYVQMGLFKMREAERSIVS